MGVARLTEWMSIMMEQRVGGSGSGSLDTDSGRRETRVGICLACHLDVYCVADEWPVHNLQGTALTTPKGSWRCRDLLSTRCCPQLPPRPEFLAELT